MEKVRYIGPCIALGSVVGCSRFDITRYGNF